jgi:hypothetical protein
VNLTRKHPGDAAAMHYPQSKSSAAQPAIIDTDTIYAPYSAFGDR